MTEKKLIRLLQEQPYLIDRAFVRSRSEAMLLAGESNVTIEDFIERAKKSSLLSSELWDVFTGALARKRTRDLQIKATDKSKSLSYILRRPKFIRRALAAFIILLSLTAFFTMTKPGVSLAKAAYEIIIKLMDGTLVAQGRTPDDLPPINFESIPEQFDSLDQASSIIGRPVASIGYEDAVLVSIKVYYVQDLEVTLKSQYQIEENTLYLTQVFYVNHTSWGSAVGTHHIECETELQDGNTMYIGYMDDGTIFGNAYSENYNISVMSTSVDVSELLRITSEMQFIR
jgi:hypothetical protein